MIFRAIFWIGLVSLLTQQEPNPGPGRLGAGISLPPIVKSWAVTGLSRPDSVCDGVAVACAGGLGAFGGLDTNRLAAIKLELVESIKARAAQHHT